MSKRNLLVGAVTALGLAGLAVALARPEWIGLGEERIVRKRAEAYWNARVAGDMNAAAPYVHPLQKKIQADSLLVTDSYEITGVELNGEEALVSVKAKFRIKHPLMTKLEREVSAEDKWVRYKGEWYHAPHPVGLGEILQEGLGKWKPPVDPDASGQKAAK